jgi:hypothetical protein
MARGSGSDAIGMQVAFLLELSCFIDQKAAFDKGFVRNARRNSEYL